MGAPFMVEAPWPDSLATTRSQEPPTVDLSTPVGNLLAARHRVLSSPAGPVGIGRTVLSAHPAAQALAEAFEPVLEFYPAGRDPIDPETPISRVAVCRQEVFASAAGSSRPGTLVLVEDLLFELLGLAAFDPLLDRVER